MTRTNIVLLWIVITCFTSSASILTRYCAIPPTSIGFWRVLGAAMIMLPFAIWLNGRRDIGDFFTSGTFLTGALLGAHFATWCWAIQHTSIANACLFIGLQPLITPFIANRVLGERLNRWEKLAVLIAFIGTVWLTMNQLKVSSRDIPGTAVSIISAILCSAYIVCSRKYRSNHHILPFSSGVFISAAIVQAVAALLIDGHIAVGDRVTVLSLAGLILFPTILGHALILYLLKYAKPQMISFSVPTQFVVASILAVPIFNEIPATWFYFGAAFILSGVILGIAKSE